MSGVAEPPKTIRRAPISQRAAAYVRDLYTDAGWQVQMSARGALSTFIASTGKKFHHVRVVFGEDTWSDGEKSNFNQYAVANKSSPIVATYTENTLKDGSISPRVTFHDTNENRPVRLIARRAIDAPVAPKAVPKVVPPAENAAPPAKTARPKAAALPAENAAPPVKTARPKAAAKSIKSAKV